MFKNWIQPPANVEDLQFEYIINPWHQSTVQYFENQHNLTSSYLRATEVSFRKMWVAVKTAVWFDTEKQQTLYLLAAGFWVFLGRSTAWMLGSTPPWAMVTPDRSLFNSSSLRMASCRWRGMILLFLLSRAALPANSKTSAARYSKTAARYTGAPAPTRSA